MDSKQVIEMDNKYVMNTYARLPVVFVKGAGVSLWDADGKEYIDFVGGLGVAAVGHANPAVAEAVSAQAKTLVHVSNLFYTEQPARLAKKLVDLSFPGQVFFANSGAEANEAAIKMARRFANDNGRAGIILTATRSFHGRTLATLAATGQPDKQVPFAPMPQGFVHVPFNDVDSLTRAAQAGACAVMLEVVQGEGGVHVASPDYVKAARELCDKHNMLLVIDEVQTGLGRTGKMFACQHFDVTPDIMTIAKALGGGLPIGAAIAGEQACGLLRAGDHGSTFGGSLLTASAGLAALDFIVGNNLCQNAEDMGAYLRERLLEIRDATDRISDIRGLGLMQAAELKEPLAASVVDKCLAAGVVINRTSATTLRFLPPLIVTTEHIDRLAVVLKNVLEEL